MLDLGQPESLEQRPFSPRMTFLLAAACGLIVASLYYAQPLAGPIREALDFRARYPDGRMGSDPGQATPEKGGELVAAAVAGLIEDVAAFSAEVAPA